jgi:anti-sigma B factor antagonist
MHLHPEPEPSESGATVVDVDGTRRVVVRGEIDLTTAPQLTAAIDAAIDGASHVEVDFSNTTFMDSSGVAVLVDAYTHLGERRGAVVLRDPSPAVRRVLALGEVEDLFVIVTSAD